VKCIRVALDWSPNTLHAGLLIGKYSGAYRRAGLDVVLESPEEDAYINTPAKKLVTGQVHVAIAPSDSVISYRTLHKEYPVIGIATIQQRHNSAIVSLSGSGIEQPKNLDGKRYGSYSARFEDAIVRQMIRNDGGCGMVRIVHPPKLSMWDALINGEIDSTWIFVPWEGALARKEGIELHLFNPEDFGVPYAYSPLMLTTERLLKRYPEHFKEFMALTARCYEWAARFPADAAELLAACNIHPDLNDAEFNRYSLELLAPALLNTDGKWGLMQPSGFQPYCHWLEKHELIKHPETEIILEVSSRCNHWFSNEFLPY
jgi:ABC-type nitrate/sulfonate/bicarbonate transport system substrate-binding protein